MNHNGRQHLDKLVHSPTSAGLLSFENISSALPGGIVHSSVLTDLRVVVLLTFWDLSLIAGGVSLDAQESAVLDCHLSFHSSHPMPFRRQLSGGRQIALHPVSFG